MGRRSSRPHFWASLNRLGFRSYDAYLRSRHWAAVKRSFRASDREQSCYCCGEFETHLHHKTYERLGAELLEDLVPLCGRCHSLVHVLEQRGDLALDLAGLLDRARAARYAREREPVREPEQARADDDQRRRARAHEARIAWRRRPK